MARKTKQQALETRQHILDVAMRLFSQQGVSSTSLAQIAQAAGVTRGAIYWHFKDKTDLFSEIWQLSESSISDLETEYRAKFPEDPLSVLREILVYILEATVVEERRRLMMEIIYHKCELVGEMAVVQQAQRSLCLESYDRIEQVLTQWRNMWDWGIFIGSFVPPLVIGVAFGNLLQGVPFHIDEYMRLYYTGNFFQLLNPFGLLAGVVSVAMIITQGATYLQMRTVGELHLRSRATAQVAALITLVCFALAGVWVMYGIDGYVITSAINHTAPSNPLTKEVARQAGAWLVNFNNMPVLWAIPALGVLLPLLTILTSRLEKGALAFVFSSLTLACIILTAGIAMFPFVMPSSTMMNASLTMWDATSSQLTLNLMTYVACVFVPIILLYTAWCYWKMFGRITKEDIESNTHSLY